MRVEYRRVIPLLRHAVPALAVATVLAAFIYAVGQQVLRQGADDPQIQLAEDAAARLAAGQPAQSLLPAATIDPSASLAPFVIVYDRAGRVLASSATLHGQTPVLPAGVLGHAGAGRDARVTWQPEAGVRIAAVVARASDSAGYVLAGRSLREVERRENQVRLLAVAGWLAAALAGVLASVVVQALTGAIETGGGPRAAAGHGAPS